MNLEDLLIGGGVASPAYGIYTHNFMYGYSSAKIETERVVVWVPPTEGRPATPYISPTPTLYEVSNNVGWNSFANSVAPLTKGSLFDFTCATGISGCLIGVAPKSQAGMPISMYSHAVIVGTGGIHIQENGILVKHLTWAQHVLQKVRLYRQVDGSIVYTVVYDGKTAIYTGSLYALPTSYVHAHLYTTGDKVMSAQYLSGDVKYGSV